MPSQTLAEITSRIPLLTEAEKLWLMKRLAGKHRNKRRRKFGDDLDAMAADPNIQREIKAIEAEFAQTEMDGLEKM